jgi:hypothetical protein
LLEPFARAASCAVVLHTVPILVLVALNFAVGMAAARAAARELRASPRAAHETVSFRAVLLHDLLVPIPIAIYLLARLTDWSVSYLVPHVPSLVLAALVVLHSGAALAGFVLGARLLRDHRPGAIPVLVALSATLALVGIVIARHRLGVVGTYAQYRGGFGLRGFESAGLAGPLAALFVAWTSGAAHLFYSLVRKM